MAIVGMLRSPEALAASFRTLRPDVVVCDVWFGRTSAIPIVAELLGEYKSARVLMFSGDASNATVQEALTAGAVGYVSKAADAQELVECVTLAASQTMVFDRATASAMITNLMTPNKNSQGISSREVEVLELLAEGFTQEAIAKRMIISPKTVKTYTTRIFTKLGVHDRGSAVAAAIRLGLIR